MESNLVYGIHAVRSIIHEKADCIQEIFIQKKHHHNQIRSLVQQIDHAGITLRFVEKRVLDFKTSSATHQGILAVLQATPIYGENDLYALLDTPLHSPFLLLLDGITDPHNLGACLRSANAAGVDAVITCKNRSAPLNGIAHKVASGAAEKTPFFTVTNLARTLKEIAKRGIWIVGTAEQGEQTIYQAPLHLPLALVVGSEDKGLRQLTRQLCHQLTKVPMAGSVSSLNVSVATGICLFEAVRQRQAYQVSPLQKNHV